MKAYFYKDMHTMTTAAITLPEWKKMTSKYILPIAVLALLTTYPVFAVEPGSGKSPFHPPQTEAERALDAIFKQAIDDLYDDQVNYGNRGHAGYIEKKIEVYPDTFSSALIAAWKKASTEKPMKKGDYCPYKKFCGADHEPVTCTTDSPDYFFFRQESLNEYEAIITTSWPGSEKVLGTYRLLKVHDKWQIDGISCGKDKFNMP
jgi:hypothetical protein